MISEKMTSKDIAIALKVAHEIEKKYDSLKNYYEEESKRNKPFKIILDNPTPNLVDMSKNREKIK